MRGSRATGQSVPVRGPPLTPARATPLGARAGRGLASSSGLGPAPGRPPRGRSGRNVLWQAFRQGVCWPDPVLRHRGRTRAAMCGVLHRAPNAHFLRSRGEVPVDVGFTQREPRVPHLPAVQRIADRPAPATGAGGSRGLRVSAMYTRTSASGTVHGGPLARNRQGSRWGRRTCWGRPVCMEDRWPPVVGWRPGARGERIIRVTILAIPETPNPS